MKAQAEYSKCVKKALSLIHKVCIQSHTFFIIEDLVHKSLWIGFYNDVQKKIHILTKTSASRVKSMQVFLHVSEMWHCKGMIIVTITPLHYPIVAPIALTPASGNSLHTHTHTNIKAIVVIFCTPVLGDSPIPTNISWPYEFHNWTV